MLKINDESKKPRSTKSLVLGKAKVMSFVELKKARVAQEQAKANRKRKSSQKRKSPAPEEDASERDVSKADALESGKGKHGRKQESARN